MSKSRQVSSKITHQKGDSRFVKGIWIGKHDSSDDHLYLTETGWHRARTVRRLPASGRAGATLFDTFKGAPWGARTAAPTASAARPVAAVRAAAPPAPAGAANDGPLAEAVPAAAEPAAAAPAAGDDQNDDARNPDDVTIPGSDVGIDFGEKRGAEDNIEDEGPKKRMRFVAAMSLDDPRLERAGRHDGLRARGPKRQYSSRCCEREASGDRDAQALRRVRGYPEGRRQAAEEAARTLGITTAWRRDQVPLCCTGVQMDGETAMTCSWQPPLRRRVAR